MGVSISKPVCVQLRLACSVGDSPARVTVRNPVTWIASVEETKRMKPIDKAIRKEGE
jgi:hypothetical protein